MGGTNTKLILLMVALLLLANLSRGARPDPSSRQLPSFQGGNTEEDAEVMMVVEEGCEEGSRMGKDYRDCLTRRSLAAHLDYIYTQKQKH
ncbi:hypothetical protein MLD38_008104 [Melastoma candidum]|uniref:Uncharacterized protein n=1 Tax=Melastoma candidum TaxID=119954 RepID=A0ACB9RWZ3_9MYRT|nr:hypothetical protein MLD38_008104 [Melastoma candidum]